jgi:hypothetical protein
MDYEPQVSSYVSAMDPIIGIFETGFLLNVRPRFVHGTDQITVDFRAELSSGETGEVDVMGGAAGALQTARIRSLKWNANVVCAKGKYSVAASGRLGTGDDAEDVVLLVRARPNLMK